jgi:hypothetical protein
VAHAELRVAIPVGRWREGRGEPARQRGIAGDDGRGREVEARVLRRSSAVDDELLSIYRNRLEAGDDRVGDAEVREGF